MGAISNLIVDSKKVIYVIFILFLALGIYYGKWKSEKIIVWDTIVYYEYLTAAFMFNDMTFEFAHSLPEDFEVTFGLKRAQMVSDTLRLQWA